MTIQFSELVIFSADPEMSAGLMKKALDCKELERFADSWILLEAPGQGRFGYLKHSPKEGELWPSPMIAFKSTDIESDITELQSRGLAATEVVKSETMWHSSYIDEHGNKFLIWQEPQ